jgi:hypothetical protein
VSEALKADADFTVVHIDDCESVPAYEGELVFLRHGLGVGSFGMQVERLPAHYRGYAEHDERESGQEEIYTLVTRRVTTRPFAGIRSYQAHKFRIWTALRSRCHLAVE